VTAYAAKSTAPTTSLGHQALGDALVSYGNAFAVMMLIAAAVCVLAGVVGFYLLRREGESSTTTEPARRLQPREAGLTGDTRREFQVTSD